MRVRHTPVQIETLVFVSLGAIFLTHANTRGNSIRRCHVGATGEAAVLSLHLEFYHEKRTRDLQAHKVH